MSFRFKQKIKSQDVLSEKEQVHAAVHAGYLLNVPFLKQTSMCQCVSAALQAHVLNELIMLNRLLTQQRLLVLQTQMDLLLSGSVCRQEVLTRRSGPPPKRFCLQTGGSDQENYDL